MPALRLFVSHSSRLRDNEVDDAQAQKNWQLLQETCGTLDAAYPDEAKVLVDYAGLQASDDWEKCLDQWLYDCHTGVLLLSKRAVQSAWVIKEATILCWRAAIEPDFRLFTVLLDGLTPEDLEQDAHFRALRLTRFQVLRVNSCAQSIVTGLRPQLDPRVALCKTPPTPLEKIAAAIEKILSEQTGAGTLETVCAKILASRPPLKQLDCRRAVARLIAAALLREGRSALEKLRHLLDDPVALCAAAGPAQALFRLLRPLWVEADAAGIIARSTAAGSALALNGQHVSTSIDDWGTTYFTLERYLERAWPDSNQFTLVASTRTCSAEEIWDDVRSGCSPLGKRHLSLSGRTDDRCVRQCSERGGHVIVLLTAEEGVSIDPALLGQLRALAQGCDSLLFIFHVGVHMPAALTDGLQAILPALPEGEDDRQLTEEHLTRNAIRRKYT